MLDAKEESDYLYVIWKTQDRRRKYFETEHILASIETCTILMKSALH